jgi:hypothetical protein
VVNATFSNISAISWRPVLGVEEAGVHGERTKRYYNSIAIKFHWKGIELLLEKKKNNNSRNSTLNIEESGKLYTIVSCKQPFCPVKEYELLDTASSLQDIRKVFSKIF